MNYAYDTGNTAGEASHVTGTSCPPLLSSGGAPPLQPARDSPYYSNCCSYDNTRTAEGPAPAFCSAAYTGPQPFTDDGGYMSLSNNNNSSSSSCNQYGRGGGGVNEGSAGVMNGMSCAGGGADAVGAWGADGGAAAVECPPVCGWRAVDGAAPGPSADADSNEEEERSGGGDDEDNVLEMPDTHSGGGGLFIAPALLAELRRQLRRRLHGGADGLGGPDAPSAGGVCGRLLQRLCAQDPAAAAALLSSLSSPGAAPAVPAALAPYLAAAAAGLSAGDLRALLAAGGGAGGGSRLLPAPPPPAAPSPRVPLRDALRSGGHAGRRRARIWSDAVRVVGGDGDDVDEEEEGEEHRDVTGDTTTASGAEGLPRARRRLETATLPPAAPTLAPPPSKMARVESSAGVWPAGGAVPTAFPNDGSGWGSLAAAAPAQAQTGAATDVPWGTLPFGKRQRSP